MSELLVKNPPGALVVKAVESGSAAARAGIAPGDLLREINGKPILDILDYQFHSAESRLKIVLEREGKRYVAAMRVPEGETPGLTFLHDLGDKIHTCNNRCVFCFIHQMPKRMRKTLYLMDDDFRLSFMHGNYVTLTNLTPQEWERIKEQRLSPLYVSVHATDPLLRARLLGRPEPAPILPQLCELADSRIDVHAQIVLCPGLNDGDSLQQTLEELADLHPARSGKRCGVRSAAIVPVGVTRFRERLPKLTTASRDYAAQMIAAIDRQARRFRKELGTRFAWLSDEWYFLAEKPFPSTAHYEDFPQLEDGIGTVRLFLDDAKRLERRLPDRAPKPVSATLVTAELPAQVVQTMAARLNRIEGVEVNVCVVKNRFFGGSINIAGLITATDLLEQLADFPVRETLYLPSICLREDWLFLDDYTVEDIRRETGRGVRVVGTKPSELAAGMGLTAPRRRGASENRWRMEEEPDDVDEFSLTTD
jgi:putative radical SAM enzyme (TIGR03279 family)